MAVSDLQLMQQKSCKLPNYDIKEKRKHSVYTSSLADIHSE